MDLVVDIEKTYGEFNFLAKEEKEVSKNTPDGGFIKTGELFYKYRFASEITEQEIVVKCPVDRDFKRFEAIRLFNATVKPYVQSSGNFSMVAFSINAEDIVSASQVTSGNTQKSTDSNTSKSADK